MLRSKRKEAVLNITEYVEPVEFLEILLKDYNYYSNKE